MRRMQWEHRQALLRAIGCVLLAGALAPRGTTAQGKAPQAASTPTTSATQLARLGEGFLSVGDSATARKYCEKALEAQLENPEGAACLQRVVAAERIEASLKQEADRTLDAEKLNVVLAEARARIRAGEYDKAIAALSGASTAAKTPAETRQIAQLLEEAYPTFASRLTERATASWVFDVGFAIALLIGVFLALVMVRYVRRRYRAYRTRLGPLEVKANWLLLPIEDKQDLGIHALVLEALARMKSELESDVDIPTLLPLRPVRGEPFEPDVWKDFRVDPPRRIREIQDQLQIQLRQHEIELVDAVQDLQLKVGGVELGNVARFMRNTWRWFNVGVPTIAGTAAVAESADGEKEVTIRLTRSADGMDFATVLASTSHRTAGEAARLAAERVAYKLLYRFARPECSAAEVDALAARRQGIDLLQRFVTSGEAAGELRRIGLEKAVFNLRFARMTLPNRESDGSHGARSLESSQDVVCELHLFEAIGQTLLGDRKSALELLRTLEDLAQNSKPQHRPLRLQAYYNHAVLEQRTAHEQPEGARASLASAIQLYKRVIDESDAPGSKDDQPLLNTIRFLAQFGYVVAASQYCFNRRDMMDPDELGNWLAVAGELLNTIENPSTKPREGGDERVSEVIKLEANRAYAVLALRYLDDFGRTAFSLPTRASVVTRAAAGAPSDALRQKLEQAIRSLGLVERHNGELTVYRQLVLAQLFAQDVAAARRFALRAIRLGASPEGDELVFYAATLGAWIGGNPVEAKHLCEQYRGAKTIPEFIAMELDLRQQQSGGLTPSYFLPESAASLRSA